MREVVIFGKNDMFGIEGTGRFSLENEADKKSKDKIDLYRQKKDTTKQYEIDCAWKEYDGNEDNEFFNHLKEIILLRKEIQEYEQNKFELTN